MSADQSAGDEGKRHPPAEREVATGEATATAAAAGALQTGTGAAGTTTARPPPGPAPDGSEGGNRSRNGGSRRRQRRHSFDGAAGRTARRRPGSNPSASGGAHGCRAATAERRGRSSSCSPLSTSGGSALIAASVTVWPGDGSGGGREGATITPVTASPRRQEWAKFVVDRKEAPAVADDDVDVVATAAAGESCGSGSTVVAGPAGAAGASSNVEEVGADEGSKNENTGGSAGIGGKKGQLPLRLEPLAGRCWFEGCGKISSFRCRRCRLAFYCGRAHQRGHWARHRGSCEEGRGDPSPPLARLARPPQRQKSVGWADSATPRSTAGGAGGRGGGGGGIANASAEFRNNKSRLEAAMASGHSKAAAANGGGFDPNQVRSARGGTSWTVPTSNSGSGSGSGAGSAKVWPVSSSAGGAGGAGGGARMRQRGGLASQLPPLGSPPPPPGPPPPAKIPAPASRPLMDKIAAAAAAAAPAPGPGYAPAEVGMLTEMGFERARAVQALQTCGGSVERAAEFLLTGYGGGGGDGAGGGDGVAHGPHLPGAGGQDGDGGGRGWLGGGTELEAVEKTGSGGDGGGGHGGGDKEEDDLITTADASDVGQGLDMRDFWSSDGTGGGGAWAAAEGEDGALFGKPGWGRGAAGREGMAAVVEDDDDEDFVTCYEDTVGGVQADVVIFFRPADAAGATAPAPALATTDGADAIRGTVGGEAGEGMSGEQGGGAVLTVVVRPLPSTAPASVDSGSSRGDYERHDFGHDVEHAVSLPWPKAEDLARRHETAQALRAASSTAVAAAAAAVGIEGDELAGHGGGGGGGDGTWRQGAGAGGTIFGDDLPPPLSPSSPLRPTSRSYDDGAGGVPSWGRKKKVGELIVGMMERRLDGGYDIFPPEIDRASRFEVLGEVLGTTVFARTYERPRGRSVPKWDGAANITTRGPAAAAATWGSLGGELTQQHNKEPWHCQVCTFFNEDPAFRSTCEMCRTPRPSTIDVLVGQQQPQVWDDDLERVETAAAAAAAEAAVRVGEGPGGSSMTASAASSAGGRLTSIAATPRMEPTISDGEVYAGGLSGVADGSGSDDNDGAVDGILGGLSPGGGGFPTAASATDVSTVPFVAGGKNTAAGRNTAGGVENAGIDWERGEQWEGFGNASFGDDSPVVGGSPRHTAFGFPMGRVHGGDGADGAGDGGRGSEGRAP